MATRTREVSTYTQSSQTRVAQPRASNPTLHLTLSSQASAAVLEQGGRSLIERIRHLQLQDQQSELESFIESLRSMEPPSEELTSWLNSWDLCSKDADDLEKQERVAELILEVLAPLRKRKPAVLTLIKTATLALETLLPKEKEVGSFLEEKKADLKERKQKLKEEKKAARAEARALKIRAFHNREAELIQSLRGIQNPSEEIQVWLSFWDQNSPDFDEEMKRKAIAELILDLLIPFWEESEEQEEISSIIRSAFLALKKLLHEQDISAFLQEKLQEKQAEEANLLEPFLLAQLQIVQGAIPSLENWLNDWDQDLEEEERKILLAFLIIKILAPAFQETNGNSFIFSLNEIARKLLQKMLGEDDLINFLSQVQKADFAGQEEALTEDLCETIQAAANEALSGLMDGFDDARRDSRQKVQDCYRKVAATLQSLDSQKQDLVNKLCEKVSESEEKLSKVETSARDVFSKQKKLQEELDQVLDQAIHFLEEIKR